MSDFNKERSLNLLKKIFLPAPYDTLFTKYRTVFFAAGIFLLFLGFGNSIWYWSGLASLIIFLIMLCSSLLARRSMLKKLSQGGSL